MEHEKQGFVSRYIFSFDHKMIGKQYFTLAMSMGFIGGILAVLIRLQLGFPSQPWPFLENLFPVGMASGIMTPEFYVSLFTMHGTIMVFLPALAAPGQRLRELPDSHSRSGRGTWRSRS